MEQIYILKLRAGKYYIGKTKNIEKRYEEHLTGTGSGWTKKYKPVSLIKTIKSTSPFDEDKYVKEYMAKYGIENVRGGSYSNIVLDENSIAVLEKEIRHSNNVCMRCGRDTHYIKDCYAKTDVDGAIINDVKKKEPVIRKAKTTKKKKHWDSDDSDSEYGDDIESGSDSEYGDDIESGSEYGDDSEDETMNVLMAMTSGMLKNARKNRAIL
jgi:predicted GIY-YIG superfamily endonuclease